MSHAIGTKPRSATAATLVGVAITAFASTLAMAEEASLQDIARLADSLPQVVIYSAKEIVTLDPARPTAQAVAVVGDRILAVGSLDELKAAAGPQPYTVNTTFANQVIVPMPWPEVISDAAESSTPSATDHE